MTTMQSVCRTCLIGDVDFSRYTIEDTQFQELYEKLTSIKHIAEDKMPKRICCLCHAVLQRFKKFFNMAVKSEKILRDISNNSKFEKVTLNTVISNLNLRNIHKLTISPVQYVSMDDNYMKNDFTEHPNSVMANRQVKSYVCTPKIDKIEIIVKPEILSEDVDIIKTEANSENEDIEMECSLKTESLTDEINNATNDTKEKLYNCENCDKTFSRKLILKYHMQNCSGKETIQIKSKTSINPKKNESTLLSSQLNSHPKKKRFTCDGCEKSYTTKQSLQNHMKVCQFQNFPCGSQTFCCRFCRRPFDSESDLSNHVIIHDKKKPFDCDNCTNRYTTRQALKRHSEHCSADNGTVNNNCNICSQTFTSRKELLKHLNKDHEEDKPFVCGTCNAKFWQKSNFKMHVFFHTGEKPYNCDRCGKMFALRSHLKMHMRIHTGVKPFTCKICGRAFYSNGILTLHMRSHTGEKPYACTKCNKSFGDSSTRKLHMRNVHTETKPFICSSCELSFTTESNLTKHMRVHTAERPYACDICDKAFIEVGHLKSHMQVHSEERPHVCSACGKSYKRREHLKLHINHKCKASLAVSNDTENVQT